MKTAKEITEYIEKEHQYNQQQFTHLVHITHEKGYYQKMDYLSELRKYLLMFEYLPDKEIALKGIEDALKWMLEDGNK